MVNCDELAVTEMISYLLPVTCLPLLYHVMFGVGIPVAVQVKFAESPTWPYITSGTTDAVGGTG